jgi:hypothetical protein
MLTIQRNYWKDLESARAKIEFKQNPTKIALYQAIAAYLGIDFAGMELDQLWAAIDSKNLDLACEGVPKMAAKLDKPLLKRDRKPVPKPVKRTDLPVVRTLPPTSVMAKALAKGGLVIVPSGLIQV